MPANYSARVVLWIGLILTGASVLLRVLSDLMLRLTDPDQLQSLVNTWWYDLGLLVPMLLVPLGTLMIAAFFVARLIDRGTGDSDRPAFRITAGWVFWSGVVLTLIGLLVGASLEEWHRALNADGRTSIALDAINLIVSPLRSVLLPLGLALLPAAVLMKKLEARAPAQLPR